MKTKNEKLTAHYFRELQKVWLPWKVHAESDDLLVPLCTPLRQSADVIVIGAGHSRFDGEIGSSPLADVVAERFSQNPPDENTFVAHDHDFASAMREMMHEITGLIFDRNQSRTRKVLGQWMGTNRCAVQFKTRPEETILKLLKIEEEFAKCLEKSDKVIREMVAETRPKFVLLMGRVAISIFHDEFESASYSPDGGSINKDRGKKLKAEINRCRITGLGSKTFASSRLIPMVNFSGQTRHRASKENPARLIQNGVPAALGWPKF